MTASSTSLCVLTIGHSNLPLQQFMSRLKEHLVDMIVDIRSYPHTQLHPWFGKRKVKMSLIREGIVYCYLGKELGARPKDEALLGRDGKIDWRRYEGSAQFQSGVDWVLDQAVHYRLCLMEGSGRLDNSHRHNFIAQALLARGCQVVHILPSGELQKAAPDLYHYQSACEGSQEGGRLK